MRRTSKLTTSQVRALNVRKLARGGWLLAGTTSYWRWGSTESKYVLHLKAEGDQVVLTPQGGNRDKSRDVGFVVKLTRTPCHLGGSRQWFICPSFWCQRRVAKLYGGDIFRCRRCCRLAYECSRENAGHRALRQAQKLRIRLGGSADMSKPFPDKPKRMHWKTYDYFSSKSKLYELEYLISLQAIAKLWINQSKRESVW